ncbi:MAG: (2Fe-2S)-binding protein, partial [Rhodobacteraceae bacterium]|nr:(2Fe-2S)-binding protein [Paracoccaceae bacterium]
MRSPRCALADSSRRLAKGGRIDRSRPLRFRFDGRDYLGYAGDTLASALLANGVEITARSFKYHRPRGIMGAGVEEPATLVELTGNLASGNRPATTVTLTDGLVARSVNTWPSARWDLGAVNQLIARLIPAG